MTESTEELETHVNRQQYQEDEYGREVEVFVKRRPDSQQVPLRHDAEVRAHEPGVADVRGDGSVPEER